MGISSYYTATREQPLTDSERDAIDAAVARYPLAGLIAACGYTELERDGEEFSDYPHDESTEPGVVFEGATKLTLFSEDAMWASVQYWCRLLSEIRRVIADAEWRVHVDDHDIPWSERLQAFDPSAD